MSASFSNLRRTPRRGHSLSRRGRRKRLWAIERLEDRTLLATFTVNSLFDSPDANPGDGLAQTGIGLTTLRAAVMEADARAGDDTIILPAGTYTIAQTGRGEDAAATGDFDVVPNGRLTITGAGAAVTIIDAATLDRTFHVLPFANLSLSGVSIVHGFSVGAEGGGIVNAGTLAISNSVVANNLADRGGGIYNTGALTISGTTLSGNSATGGAVYNAGGTVTISSSAVSANFGGQEGTTGGVHNHSGALTIVNSTISGNSAAQAGGIFNNAALTLKNSTVASNSATMSAGGASERSGGVVNSSSGTLTLQNTIVGGNSIVGTGSPDFSGAATSLGNNLIGNTSGSSDWLAGDLQNVDPLLGPLADNGGLTKTHALLTGSPALDAGNNTGAPANDQRGAPYVRIFNGTIDIGAYESQSVTFIVDISADENDGNYSTGDLSLREAVLLTNSNAGHDTIQFAQSVAGAVTLTFGELLITSDLTINGPGASGLAISGNNSSRVFNIATGTAVELSGITIRNGRAVDGGAVFNRGTLTLTSSTISTNSSTNNGGGIFNDASATLMVVSSTISGNTASNASNAGAGGGVYNSGALIIESSTVTTNSARIRGGGIYNDAVGTLAVTATTVTGNISSNSLSAGDGAGMYNAGSLNIANSTINGNSARLIGGGLLNARNGRVTILGTTIMGNTASTGLAGAGGGVANFGELSIANSTVSGNTTPINGAGIYNAEFATLSVSTCIVSGNSATGFVIPIQGGGVHNRGAATITSTTISGNSVSPEGSSGGGIYNYSGTLNITNSTISGNSGNQTGGIYNNAQLVIKNSTVTANSTNMFVGPPSEGSGGITNSPSGSITLQNAIVARNIAGTVGGTPDFFGAAMSLGNNLIGNTTGSSGWIASDLQNVDPRLGPLTNNGGTTQTHALLDGSPAIDAGNNAEAPPNDQRGPPFLRIVNGTVDIGAYERQSLTFVVDTTVDESDGNYGTGDLSLREAIVLTSSNPGQNVIQFDAALAGSTITLTLGEVLLSGHVNIVGLGANDLAISGNNSSRVFNVAAGAILDLSELTIRDGRATQGGGIFNSGTITLTNSAISSNSLTGGFPGSGGGGIFNSASGTLTIANSTINANSATGSSIFPQGGGIYNQGTISITSSTISGNTAFNSDLQGTGGGVYSASGTTTIINSTISGNSANLGGAILNNATMAIRSSTVTGNSSVARPLSASGPAGIAAGGTVTIQNTIIANNPRLNGPASINFSGTVNSLGNNLISTLEGTGWIASDLRNIDPRLGSFGNNGGQTMTQSLLPESPAIDAGNNAGAPPTDQRGFRRPRDGNGDGLAVVDIGAYEFIPGILRVEAANDTATVNEDSSNNAIDVLANDHGPPGNTLTIVAVTQSAHGTVAIGQGGANVLYTPNANFVGTDTFGYTVSDGTDAAAAMVSVTVVNVDTDFQGTSGDDVFLIRRDASGNNVQLFDNDTATGTPIYSGPLAAVTSLRLDTLGGNDRLIVDWVNGDPLPSEGIQYVGGPNGAAGDKLSIRGTGATNGAYIAGTTTGSGVLAVGGRSITLTGVEPVDVDDCDSFTVVTPNANDTLSISAPAIGAMRFSGTSSGLMLSPITLTNVALVIIDAATNDAGVGDDSLAISTSGQVPWSLAFLQYRSGTGTNTLIVQNGTARIDATVAVGGTLNTTVGDAAQIVTHRFRQTSLIMGNGTRATILPDGTDAATSLLNSLTINTGGTLDVNDNALILDYIGASPTGTIRSKIIEGRGGAGVGKTWNGTGITSSTAAQASATAPESQSVGYAENALLPLGPYTTFRGQPVDPTSVLIAYTWTADANLDGVVNDDDVTVVGTFYAPGVSKPAWANGDFDYNGFIDDDDVTLLGVFYNPSAAPPPPTSPPPTSTPPHITAISPAPLAVGWAKAAEAHASRAERPSTLRASHLAFFESLSHSDESFVSPPLRKSFKWLKK